MTVIETLAREAGLAVRDVNRIVLSAPKRYKTYSIPKRHGGERIIAQPAFEVKVLQRLLMTWLLRQYPVHECAYAYVKGRSIRQNALKHATSNNLLKLDFKDFFHSIRPVDFERTLRKRPPEGIHPTEYEALYQLLFWGAGSYQARCLSIGAPSSPAISNIVMYEFDCAAGQIAVELGVTYTRYADDLTISTTSGASPLLTFERRLNLLINDMPLDLTLNHSKRGLYGRGQRRMVTGLIITPDHKVSIGRERKRLIRAMVNRYQNGDLDDRSIMRCKGMLGFIIAAEPSFLGTLIKRYGRETIKSILRTPQMSFYHPDDIGALE